MEVRARIAIAEGQLEAFAAEAATIVARAPLARLVRSDWFVNDGHRDAIAMIVGPDEAASAIAADLRGLRAGRVTALDLLGRPSPAACDALAGFSPSLYQYGGGLDPSAPTVGTTATAGLIEIFTGFAIHPEALAAFRARADELIAIVAAEDPATPRYDWFYDESGTRGIAMDSYLGAAGMFAHMKNCHAAHEALLGHATMVTEFLGALPDEAMAAVARYDPYILKRVAGLSAA